MEHLVDLDELAGRLEPVMNEWAQASSRGATDLAR
jgi:hypothetical protein